MLLLVMSPAAHDRYFIELAEILAADGPPDSEAIADLRGRYDIEHSHRSSPTSSRHGS